jgi:hypothetical protein
VSSRNAGNAASDDSPSRMACRTKSMSGASSSAGRREASAAFTSCRFPAADPPVGPRDVRAKEMGLGQRDEIVARTQRTSGGAWNLEPQKAYEGALSYAPGRLGQLGTRRRGPALHGRVDDEAPPLPRTRAEIPSRAHHRPGAAPGANAIVVFFGMSWGPVVWVLLGEMFPNRFRAIALSVAATANWLANFAPLTSFPPFQDLGLGVA